MKSSLTENELCEDLVGLMHRLQVHGQMDSILFLSIPHKVPKSSFIPAADLFSPLDGALWQTCPLAWWLIIKGQFCSIGSSSVSRRFSGSHAMQLNPVSLTYFIGWFHQIFEIFFKIFNSLLIFYQREKLHSFHKQYLKGYLVFEYCPMPNTNLDCKRIASKILDCSAMANQDKYHQAHQRTEPLWMYFVFGHQLLRMLNLSLKIESGP